MKIFSTCKGCNKRKFIIKQREYVVPGSKQTMTSQSELCRPCFKSIRSMISQFK